MDPLSLRTRPPRLTRPAWRVADLVELRLVLRDLDGDVGEAALAMGRDRQDVDRALWSLVGRTPLEARAELTLTRARLRARSWRAA